MRAGIVEKAGDYRWSSASVHIGRNEAPVVSKACPVIGSMTDWIAFAYQEQRDDQLVKAFRESTKNGRPCGDNSFVKKVEELLGDNRGRCHEEGRDERDKEALSPFPHFPHPRKSLGWKRD